MSSHETMPNALQVARAVSQVLRTKLAVFDAEDILLTREEAALCLGLAEGVVDHFEHNEPGPS